MPTGLNIRDFSKVYRELRYANQGSIRLSEIEHNAYLNRLTVEITHYDAYRSINYKTSPDNTHWGYLTSFKGTAVVENLPVKFVKQRVFELVNQGIWEYHQNNENFRLNNAANVAIANEIIAKLLDESIPFPGIQTLLELVEGFEDGAPSIIKWLFSIDDADDPNGPQQNARYTAYPISSPFPDVWKFKADIPVSFLFRLESWYLLNPAVYIIANPTDTSDETEAEDEYQEPSPGDGNGDSQDFPPSSPNDPNNDSRDGGQKPAAPIIATAIYNWNGVIFGTALNSSAQQESVAYPFTFQAQGNQSPFTATTTQNVIIVHQGVTYYGGVLLRDRFGQSIGTYFTNTGWVDGSVSVNATVGSQV